MRFARFLSPLALPLPLSLGTSSVCYVCVVCVFYFSLFFGVNFSVEFCMLHSRTETFLIPSFHFILRSLILFCFAFADCFVFEKWLSHHFYCIFECLSLSISMYLSPCVCACVLGVCHKDLCVAIYTHSQKHREREGRRWRGRVAQKTKQSICFTLTSSGKRKSLHLWGLALWKWQR